MTIGGTAALGILALLVGYAAIVDIRQFIIPDTVNVAIFSTGLTASFTIGHIEPLSAVLAVLLGGGILLAVQAGFRAYQGYDGLGTGDVKLVAAGATWTGLEGLAPTLLVACLMALAYISFRRILDAEFSTSARIPFGPFLAFGITVAAAPLMLNRTSWFELLDRLAP